MHVAGPLCAGAGEGACFLPICSPRIQVFIGFPTPLVMTIICPSHVQLQVFLCGQVFLQTASGKGDAIRTLYPFHGEHTTGEDALEFRVT